MKFIVEIPDDNAKEMILKIMAENGSVVKATDGGELLLNGVESKCLALLQSLKVPFQSTAKGLRLA